MREENNVEHASYTNLESSTYASDLNLPVLLPQLRHLILLHVASILVHLQLHMVR